MSVLIEVDDGQFLLKEVTFVLQRTVFVVSATGTVKGKNVFTVVLDARAVDVEGRCLQVVNGLAKETVPALGLAQRKRRVGNVDEEIDAVLFL